MEFPNHEIIAEIIYSLRRELFPEYFPDRDTTMDIREQLRTQIEIALRHRKTAVPGEDIGETAQKAANTFFQNLRDLKPLLKADALAGFNGDPAAYSVDEVILAYPGFFTTLVHRMAHELYSLGIPLIPRMMCEYAHSKTGIDIHPGARIGRSFFIDHGTGVVIGETTEIGDNVKLYQGVTLGALSTKDGQMLFGKKRHPTVESNVTIYAGTAILGGNTVIGEGSTIGGNAFITASVPPKSKIKGSESST